MSRRVTFGIPKRRGFNQSDEHYTCLALVDKFWGTGDSGLVSLADWEEIGLSKDKGLGVGMVRGGERERGERRVSMLGAEEKELSDSF